MSPMKADSPEVSYVYEASNYGGSHDPNVFCVHSVECPIEDGFARSLIGPNWFGGPAPTSAHYLIGPDDTCQGVPENRVAWHCGNGNRNSIAGEQCGYARYDQAQWNSIKGRAQRTRFARLLADINKRRPLIQLRQLSLSELRYALTHPGTPGGICTHDQMRQAMGGTTHYDPMNSPGAPVAYPLSDLINEAIQIRNGTPTDWFDMATSAELEAIVDKVVKANLEIYLADSSPYTSNIADKVMDRLTNSSMQPRFDQYWYGQQVTNNKVNLVDMIVDKLDDLGVISPKS